ncbi:uncharacterized protein TRAVEDRAFT_73558 [Trametes versicolor FP-101664 SS1]|uniref:uncharacterized protein n=1 Tax=Trametes versicolor (strain FP-101664) TaxID=717944 RepID=UPI0004623B0C|nr:uncharacterized protein TRAVEDRAFT_73558 [Trametes versicolor FP-101664 SS1]EIW55762.1 hypothetical protein TRAVEDRAFT_73558 [Trametes versicolor FP-101664 SS1]
MPDLSTLLGEAQSHLDLLNLIKYAGLASLTYVLLDILDTLSDEIALVWPSRLSAMKVIFLVNRYMPIVDVSLGNAVILGVRTHQTCSVMWPLVVALYPLGSFISEIILMVRTVALWNFSRIIVGLMMLNTLIIVVPTVAVVQQYLQTLHYPSTAVLEVTDCVASISDGVGWVFYGCIIISETTVVALTLLKMYLTSGRGTSFSLLFRTMYRDGTGFYILLLTVSVTNLLCMTTAPVWVSSALQLPHRAIHSTLCSRVLLNLRKAAARSSGVSWDEFNKRSELAFERRFSDIGEDSFITLTDLER